VSCWGYNYYGEVGDGTTTQRSSPVAVSGLTGAQSLTLGAYHTCASTASGGVSCWGWDLYGQLGNGSVFGGSPIDPNVLGTPALSPLAVPAFSGVSQLGLGMSPSESCALMNDGTVRCWGYYQGLGRSTPMPVVWP
jgi:alpha-tubulin suppressor-like RCC1 family protein